MTKKTFGVIGVCGANGNLIARILEERGYDVIGTDLSSAEKCRFSKSLEGYDMELYYGETPDEFFEKSDYIVPPASLSKKSAIFKKIDKSLFELEDVIDNFIWTIKDKYKEYVDMIFKYKNKIIKKK